MPKSFTFDVSRLDGAGGRRCGSRPNRLEEFDELIAAALNNPAPVQKAEQ